jgi:hypothetical protein
MASMDHRGRMLVGAGMFSVVTMAQVGVAQADSTDAAPAQGQASESCDALLDFRSEDFEHPTRIDNEFLPMEPGTRLAYRGTIVDGADTVTHEVVFTVTDLVKEVAGVPTRVIYDVDTNDGEVTEAELAFFAQDDAGDVWNLGEYPEEYDAGAFTGAPNVWIAGLEGASGGIHMLAEPEGHVGGPEYLQGEAPAIDFLDCAMVAAKNGTVEVPAGTFSDVLTTYERSPLESRLALQTKEHAPGVGIVRIGAKNDPEGETLELVSMEFLEQSAIAKVDAAAVALDAHGHQVSEVYRETDRVRHGGNGGDHGGGNGGDHGGGNGGDHDDV